MGSQIRTFIAVSVPESVRQKIHKFQKKLQSYNADIKWVRSQSIHITLKFLGNVEESRIDTITESIQPFIQSVSPFAISIEGAGAFPHYQKPRVLWIGIHLGRDVLTRIAGQICDTLAPMGFEQDKRLYSPHLTIGRIRTQSGINPAIAAMQSMTFQGGSFEAREILVMKSDLQPGGAVYTSLRSIKFEG